MNRTEQYRIYKAYLRILQQRGSVCISGVGVHRHFVFESPYGPVSTSFHEKVRRTGQPWVHFCLDLWSRDIPGGHGATWYGWRHWKQNFLAYDKCPEESYVQLLEEHVCQFFEPLRYGFPTSEVLEELRAAREARRDHIDQVVSDTCSPKEPGDFQLPKHSKE